MEQLDDADDPGTLGAFVLAKLRRARDVPISARGSSDVRLEDGDDLSLRLVGARPALSDDAVLGGVTSWSVARAAAAAAASLCLTAFSIS